jgi:phosphoglycolate phosphatase-like HAD superfamily hydrolase
MQTARRIAALPPYLFAEIDKRVAAAKAAGVKSVAVSWGAFSEDTLRSAGPDHLVPDVDSAVDVLLEMAGR